MPRIVLPLAAYRELGAFVSKEETRFYLRGICIETAGFAAATDGHMLAARRFAPEEFAASDAGAADWIVPFEGKLARAKGKSWLKDRPHWLVIDRLDLESRAVTLYAIAGGDASDALQIPREGIVAIVPAELADGSFPDWRRVVPRAGRDESSEAYRNLSEAVARWEQDPGSDLEGLELAREALGAVAWHSLARPAFSPELLQRICEAFGSVSAPLTIHPGRSEGDPALIEVGNRADIVVVAMPMRRISDARYSAPDWSAPAPAPAPATALAAAAAE